MKGQEMDSRERNEREALYLNIAVLIYIVLICGALVAFAVWLQSEHEILGSW